MTVTVALAHRIPRPVGLRLAGGRAGLSHTCTMKLAVAGWTLEGVKVMRLFEYEIDPVEMLDAPVRVLQSIGKVPAVKYVVASTVMYLSRAGEIENGAPDGDTTPAAKVTVAVPEEGTKPPPHKVYVKVS